MGAMMRPRRGRRPKSEETPEAEATEQPQAPAEAPAQPPPPTPARRRFIINLNMLSNVDVKFYTEGITRADVLGRWQAVIGRAKRERPEDTVEVVMGDGDGATSYILYLAEVTAFAIGPFVDDSDAIDFTVNV